MTRTTDELIRNVIKDADPDADLSPYILAANELVTELLVGKTTFTHSDARLQLIETWLAAHFYSVDDAKASQEIAGRVQASYQYKVDIGLNVTVYGQQAIRFDTSGTLAGLDNAVKEAIIPLPGTGPRASITWLGSC